MFWNRHDSVDGLNMDIRQVLKKQLEQYYGLYTHFEMQGNWFIAQYFKERAEEIARILWK